LSVQPRNARVVDGQLIVHPPPDIDDGQVERKCLVAIDDEISVEGAFRRRAGRRRNRLQDAGFGERVIDDFRFHLQLPRHQFLIAYQTDDGAIGENKPCLAAGLVDEFGQFGRQVRIGQPVGELLGWYGDDVNIGGEVFFKPLPGKSAFDGFDEQFCQVTPG